MKVLIPIAEQIEEMEVVILKDVLVRAGYEVFLFSIVDCEYITGTRGVQIKPDGLLSHECVWDLIVVPGGMPGAKNLSQSETLKSVLQEHVAAGKVYGGICAAPAVVLKPWGLLPQKHKTCHPSFAHKLHSWSPQKVCFADNCITSQGPGTAFAMALFLIEHLSGRELREKVEAPLCL